MKEYSLVIFTSGEFKEAPGLLLDGWVYPLGDLLSSLVGAEVPGNGTMREVLDNWSRASTLIARAVDALPVLAPDTLERYRLDDVTLSSPVQGGTIYGSGANYLDHLEEMAKVLGAPIPNPKTAGQLPWHFVKPGRNALVGSGVAVKLPAYSSKVDWEVELAVIIGKQAKDVAVEDAMAYVAGYAISNDLSARDHVKRADVPVGSPFAYDWVSQKCFDGSCPLGPGMVPAALVPDPYRLSLRLWHNGVLKQDSNTSNMIYGVAEQIAYLSSRATLFPGDVILTGTPAGVGMARGEFLAVGDTVRIEIEKLGVLKTRFV